LNASHRWIPWLLVAALAPGCVDPQSSPASPGGSSGVGTQTEAGLPSDAGEQRAIVDAPPDLSAEASPDVSAEDSAAGDSLLLAADNTRFAFDVYQSLSQTDATTNFLFAPYSISLALAMTYAGAAGETATQMASVLHFELPPPRLNQAFQAIDVALASRNGQGLTLTVADSLWVDTSFPLLQPFVGTLTTDYGGAPHAVDFVDSPDTARAAINQWISTETSPQIPSLLAPGSITSDTRVALANAIYFDGAWSIAFNGADSGDRAFTRLDGSTVSVRMMTPGSALPLSYAETSEYQAVEIPYSGGATAMVLLLPAVGQFSAVESGLNEDLFAGLTGALSRAPVVLVMPKFTLQPAPISLAAVLTNLGMSDAFTRGVADFSGMTAASNGSPWLDQVLHQAFVCVNEDGTLATAATAALLGWAGSAVVPDEVDMTIDRPFFFFIRDLPTGTVLFVGRVTDPSQ